MIGVDTNVLIRLLTADIDDQHQLAVGVFGSLSADEPAFLSAVTLAETVWVLRRSYGFTASEIGEAIELLLEREDLEIEGRESLMLLFESGFRSGQIADHLIAHLGKRAGCIRTVTFDRRAAKAVPGMELLA